MKKTLIALLATSACAMGITLEDATFASVGNTGYNSLDGKFSVVLTLDVEELRYVLEQNQPVISWGTDIVRYSANGTATGVTINGGSNASKISSSGLYARWGAANSGNDIKWNGARWDGSKNLADLNGNEAGTGWDNVAYAGLVYTFVNDGGTTVAFTLLDANQNVILESSSTQSGLKSSSAGAASLTFGNMVATSYYFDDQIAAAQALDYAKLAATTAPIPEPTTATLSLLALAGLAARRRRR